MPGQLTIEFAESAAPGIGSSGWLDGLPRELFDAQWRAVSEVRECSVSDVDTFIQRHYLQKRPAIVVLCLKMWVCKAPVGMVVYAMPPSEADTRYGGKTWELARLYLLDE